MRTCHTCACLVPRNASKCFACFLRPPPLDVDVDSCSAICQACDAPICFLHDTEEHFRAELCRDCFTCDYTRMRRGEQDSDGDELEDAEWSDDDAVDAYSLENAAEPEIEWQDHDDCDSPSECAPNAAKRVKLVVVSCQGEAGCEDACAICLEPMNETTRVVTLPCDGQHQLHHTCAQTWVNEKPTCPLCNTRLHIIVQ
jgi:hypothetical protein